MKPEKFVKNAIKLYLNLASILCLIRLLTFIERFILNFYINFIIRIFHLNENLKVLKPNIKFNQYLLYKPYAPTGINEAFGKMFGEIWPIKSPKWLSKVI